MGAIRAVAAAALTLGAGAIPAQAAERGQIICIEDALSPASVDSFRASARAAMREGQSVPASDAARAELTAAAAKCRKSMRWSDAAMNAAARYTLTGFMLHEAMLAAEDGGVATAPLLMAVRRQLTPVEKAALLDRTPAGSQRFTHLLVGMSFPVRDTDKLRLGTQVAVNALSWDRELETYLAA